MLMLTNELSNRLSYLEIWLNSAPDFHHPSYFQWLTNQEVLKCEQYFRFLFSGLNDLQPRKQQHNSVTPEENGRCVDSVADMHYKHLINLKKKKKSFTKPFEP